MSKYALRVVVCSSAPKETEVLSLHLLLEAETAVDDLLSMSISIDKSLMFSLLLPLASAVAQILEEGLPQTHPISQIYPHQCSDLVHLEESCAWLRMHGCFLQIHWR
jgi:hypothetical protein